MPPAARIAVVIGLLALAMAVRADPAMACSCASLDPDPATAVDVAAVVEREVAADRFVQTLRIEVVSSTNDNVRPGDTHVLRFATGDAGSCGVGEPLAPGERYRITGVLDGSVIDAGGCTNGSATPLGDDTAAPAPPTAEDDADGDGDGDGGNRTAGLVTMTIAILGIGFAYLRTKRQVTH